MNINDLSSLSDELVTKWYLIKDSMDNLTADSQSVIRSIISLQSQPDFVAYADDDEQNYLDSLVTYLNNFILATPVAPDSTSISKQINTRIK